MEPSIQQLIQQLAAPLQEVRDRARAALQQAAPVSIPPLLKALEHPERDIRAGAALTLGGLRASEAAPALARLVAADPDPRVRPLAMAALADLAHPGCPEAVQVTLKVKLADPDMFIRALACKGLGRIGDEPARAALRGAVADKEDWVRQAARQALAALPSAPPGQGAASPGTALMTRPAGELAVARPSAADQLIARLASLDLPSQREAQQALQRMGAQVVGQIAPLLSDPLSHVRRAASEVLGGIGAVEGLAPLQEVLAESETSHDLRAMALHAIASILRRTGPTAAPVELVELLRQHLERDDPFVRAAAAAALIAASPEDRAPVLEHLQDEDEEWIRVVAARALREVAGAGDRHLLAALLDELARMTDPAGQRHLLETLTRILPEPTPEDARLVVGPASFFLESEHREVREAALRLLARTVCDPDPLLLRAFVDLLHADPRNVELVGAVARLAAPGDAASVPALRKALTGGSEEAGERAARALASIGGRAAVDALVELANAQAGRPTALAAQALAGMEAAAQVIGARRSDGRWERRLQLRCSVDAQLLRWVEHQGREELRCPACEKEYALSSAEKLFDAERTPFGLCLCRSCRRKQPLVRRVDSETLVCPVSGEVHIRPFDHPQQLRLLSDLPLGACSCCAEPQPLLRIDDEVRCHRTRQLYRPGTRGLTMASETTQGEDFAAINRALLLGTLGIAESGLAASDVQPDPTEDDPERP